MHEKIAKYLAGELENDERLEFESLLVEDSSLQKEVFAQMQLLQITSKDNRSFNTERAFKKVKPQLDSKIRILPKRNSFSFLKIAATLLIVIAAGYFITQQFDYSGEKESLIYSTQARIDSFELPDGTIVRLNANSHLELTEGFGESNRIVTLTGAANFEVTSNENLPFVINASNGSVEVIGTVFEVHAYPEKDIELNVAEGKVRFASKIAEKEDLFTAGERGLLTADGMELTKTTRKNENYAAWWTKRLVFEDATLDEVFKDLEKTYHVNIEYDASLGNCKWGTILENYTLNDALEALQFQFSNITKVDIKDSSIKLEGTACNN